MYRSLALCTAFLLTLGFAGPARAADSPDPNAVRRLDKTVHYLDGHGVEVATCLASSSLADPNSEIDVQSNRVLCHFEDGSKIVWHIQFEIGTTGASKQVLLDVGTGNWLMISDSTDIRPREKDEPWSDWKTRMLAAEDSKTEITAETNLSRFEEFRESDGDSARKAIWRRIEDDQPELAALITRLVVDFGTDMQGVLAPIVADLTHTVYAGPEVQPSKFIVKTDRPHLVKPDAPESEFEAEFGRSATWPEMPRVKD